MATMCYNVRLVNVTMKFPAIQQKFPVIQVSESNALETLHKLFQCYNAENKRTNILKQRYNMTQTIASQLVSDKLEV